MLFNIVLLSTVFFFMRLFFINSIVRVNMLLTLNRIFLSIISFIFMIMLVTMNLLLDVYQSTMVVCGSVSYIGSYVYDSFVPTVSLNINLVQVYTYPFIYVFLLITVLSIIFCMSYNTDELMSFMLYCQVILAAGYTLFFTDSIILFFFSIRNVISSFIFYFV